jgi:glycosyltransferase
MIAGSDTPTVETSLITAGSDLLADEATGLITEPDRLPASEACLKAEPAIYLVTACRNMARTLPETLASLAEQSDEWTHHFIIDGLSSDGTVEVAQEYARLHPNKVTVISESDTGIYNAMNKGIRRVLELACDGDLIATINADDYYLPGALKLMRDRSAHNPEIDVFYGDCKLMDEGGTPLNKTRRSDPHLPTKPSCFSMPIEHPTMFVGARVYRTLGLYDETYRIAADYEFVLRLIVAQAKAQHVGAAITWFREGGISNTAIEDSFKEMIRARIAHGANPLYEWTRYRKQKLNERVYGWYRRIR